MQEQDQAKRRQQQKRRRWNNRVTGIKVTVFFGVLLLLSLIGLLWFARPSASTLEKRELTKFPGAPSGTAASSPAWTNGTPTPIPCASR